MQVVKAPLLVAVQVGLPVNDISDGSVMTKLPLSEAEGSLLNRVTVKVSAMVSPTTEADWSAGTVIAGATSKA